MAEAWDGGFVDLHLPSAVFDVVLAEWTSDDSIAIESQGGQKLPHRHVLAWVAMGEHVPLVSLAGPLTGACYFGTTITAVNATTGELIADAQYVGPPGGEAAGGS